MSDPAEPSSGYWDGRTREWVLPNGERLDDRMIRVDSGRDKKQAEILYLLEKKKRARRWKGDYTTQYGEVIPLVEATAGLGAWPNGFLNA